MKPRLVVLLVIYLGAIGGMAWYSRQKAVDFARQEQHRQETLGAGVTPSIGRLSAMSEIFTGNQGVDMEAQAKGIAVAASQELMARLSARLQAVMADQGPVAAVEVCANEAQQITTDYAAERGVQVRRVALRTRNPLNQPDKDERLWLESISDSTATRPAAASGTMAPEQEGSPSEYRYILPIYLKPLCLTCHGSAEQIPADVQAVLDERYPDDQGTGFELGALRGAVSVRIPFAADGGGQSGE